MKKVYKYPMPSLPTKFELWLPLGFKFLRVNFQDEKLFMWCEVSDDCVPSDGVKFQVFGTGHEIPDGALYLATFDNGPFVFHLYQLSPPHVPAPQLGA